MVAQALKDLHSRNGVAAEARAWLEDPAGAQRVLEGLGYDERRARRALRAALDGDSTTADAGKRALDDLVPRPKSAKHVSHFLL